MANVAWGYAQSNRMAEARKAAEEAVARFPASVSARQALVMAAQMAGDYKRADEIIAAGRAAGETEMLHSGMFGAIYEGRMGAARGFAAEELKRMLAARRPGHRMDVLLELALSEWLYGWPDRARARLAETTSLVPDAEASRGAAAVFALAGDAQRARAIMAAQSAEWPKATLVQGAWLPIGRAAMGCRRAGRKRRSPRLGPPGPTSAACPSPRSCAASR